MDFDKYKNTDPFPDMPRKPVLRENAYSSQVREYADALWSWEVKAEEIAEIRENWKKKERMLIEQFKTDAFAEVGWSNHPGVALVMERAWDDRSSEGLRAVFEEFESLIELFDEVIRLNNTPYRRN